MDFSRVPLADGDQNFLDEARNFLTTQVTDEVRRRDRETGDYGNAKALPLGVEGAADDGASEYAFRFAPLVGIYGGTLEVFRNMIAQYMLGLGKPNYLAPNKV